MSLSRKEEVERKKAKLEAMRRAKQQQQKKPEETALASALQEKGDIRSETEELLKSLGVPMNEGAASKQDVLPITTAASEGSQVSSTAVSMTSESGDVTQLSASASPAHKPRLGLSKVTQTNIPPREQVTYCKQTQTPGEQIDKPSDEDLDASLPETPPILKGLRHPLPQAEQAKPASGVEEEKKEKEKAPPRELTDEEKQRILSTEDFLRFFERTTRITERALCEDFDIFKDYGLGDEDQSGGDMQTHDKLSVNRTFFDERWSKHRIVTSLDWSTQFPELLVAAYNQNEEVAHEPEGVVLVWNQKFKKNTPEFVFHCQSSVVSAAFAKFHPHLIIGGTYSGQIVVWDNRTNKRTPVQRSPLSAAAHTHPVYCVNVVGSQNAHNLVSVSTDGKFCTWSLDMLSQPQESMELQHKQAKAVAVTCMCFPYGDVNNFIVGSEEGPIYTACRHGSKTGVLDMFEGHQGPVTGIDCHVAQGQVDLSHLFLTSSFDWTVKLWSQKENKPLYSFEDNQDYVYDARWSPINPALFATVDGMGRLDVWNLNNDTEVPTVSKVLEDGVALNKLKWAHSGHMIAVGNDVGKIYLVDVKEQVAVPKNDEWSKLVRTLQEIKSNQADAEEALNLSSTPTMSLPIR